MRPRPHTPDKNARINEETRLSSCDHFRKAPFSNVFLNVKAVLKERLNNVFEKLRIRNGLVWTVRLTVVSS